MADSWVYRLSLKVVPRVVSWLYRLWLGSCREEVHGYHNLEKALAAGGGVAVFWHYSLYYFIHHLRDFPSAVMVSTSKDGEYVARLLRLHGHTPVRASSHRRGVAGLKEMVREVKKGKNSGIVIDGSQGPPLKAQPGAILVASIAGKPVLPMVWASSSFWSVDSWDKAALPKPFSRVHVFYGEPIFIPARVSKDEVEGYCLQMDKAMNKLYQEAWDRVGRPEGHY